MTQALQGGRRNLIPHAYRDLLRTPNSRRFLTGLGVSSLGDAMSTVTVAWLAVLIAPAGHLGVFVGLAVAAYTLAGVIGAVALAPVLRHRPSRTLVMIHCLLRSGLLATIVLLRVAGALSPEAYIVLLAGSSLLSSWGNAGQYTMLAELAGPAGRLAANSLASAQTSLAVIVGPSCAGLLLARIDPGWLLGFDALSFGFLAIQTWRTRTRAEVAQQPIDTRAAGSGFRSLLRPDLLGLTAVTWLFFFLYGPVEAALPVYVASDLHADAPLLGVYWAAFGVGALAATLVTGTLRGGDMRRTALLIVAGWGACLVPFAFGPVGVTIACFAIGGVIYGPFVPLTYALFQSATTTANLPSVLAARSAVVIVSTPLGTALGGPLVGAIGAANTLAASGLATMLLAAGAALMWRRRPAETTVPVPALGEAA
jgi:predicted MFS family arabinose efflux permease